MLVKGAIRQETAHCSFFRPRQSAVETRKMPEVAPPALVLGKRNPALQKAAGEEVTSAKLLRN
jgi:hypothetical protein